LRHSLDKLEQIQEKISKERRIKKKIEMFIRFTKIGTIQIAFLDERLRSYESERR